MAQEMIANVILVISIIVLLFILCAVFNARKNSLGGKLGAILRFLVFGFVMVAVDGILVAMQLAGILEVNLATSSIIGLLAFIASAIIFTNLETMRKIMKKEPNNA
ncbi:hypothetical protein ACFLQI_03505 [Candidatus Undinarchaeota archaeon]